MSLTFLCAQRSRSNSVCGGDVGVGVCVWVGVGVRACVHACFLVQTFATFP